MIEFVSCYKSPEVVQPTDAAFDFPSFSVASELSPVLSTLFHTVAFVGSNEVNPTFEKSQSQRIAVGSSVVDQRTRPTPEDSLFEQGLNQRHFVRVGTCDHAAARQTVAVDQQHDLRTFASFGLPYTKAPFLAAENVPSAIDSSRSTSPCRSSLLTRRAQAFLNSPDSDHCLSRRQQVGYDGKCSGKSRQRAPVRSTQAMASKQSREDARGRPPRGDGGGSSI